MPDARNTSYGLALARNPALRAHRTGDIGGWTPRAILRCGASDQAASAIPAKASRTQAWVSHTIFRCASRTDVIGPLPPTTFQNSSQSGSDQSHSPFSSFQASVGSGTLIPRSQSFGTYVEKNSWRRLSFDRVLIPHSSSMSRFFDGGPKKC